jgi:hypothetical protein
VLAWQPPHRLPRHWLLRSWQIAPGWVYQRDPRRASQIEVRFTGEEDSRTRTGFEHRRLERYAGETRGTRRKTRRMRSVLDGPNGASGVLAA